MKAFYKALLIGTCVSIGSAIARAALVRRGCVHHQFSTSPPAENDVALQWQNFFFAK